LDPCPSEATAAARLSLRVVVAPMAQMTFCSFDLRAERAWATGQLDFVGTGGGTFLAPAHEGSGDE
jgi:hypothetical protein